MYIGSVLKQGDTAMVLLYRISLKWNSILYIFIHFAWLNSQHTIQLVWKYSMSRARSSMPHKTDYWWRYCRANTIFFLSFFGSHEIIKLIFGLDASHSLTYAHTGFVFLFLSCHASHMEWRIDGARRFYWYILYVIIKITNFDEFITQLLKLCNPVEYYYYLLFEKRFQNGNLQFSSNDRFMIIYKRFKTRTISRIFLFAARLTEIYI